MASSFVSKNVDLLLKAGQRELRKLEAGIQTVVEIIFPGPLGPLGMQDMTVRRAAEEAVQRRLQNPSQHQKQAEGK